MLTLASVEDSDSDNAGGELPIHTARLVQLFETVKSFLLHSHRSSYTSKSPSQLLDTLIMGFMKCRTSLTDYST